MGKTDPIGQSYSYQFFTPFDERYHKPSIERDPDGVIYFTEFPAYIAGETVFEHAVVYAVTHPFGFNNDGNE
jgi:hypothetical protein